MLKRCQSVAIFKIVFTIHFWYKNQYWYPCTIKSYIVYKSKGNFGLFQSMLHGKILEIWSKNFFTPPRGMFRIVFKNSVYEESCVLVFLNLCRNNYTYIFVGLFKILVFVPFFGWFWWKFTPPSPSETHILHRYHQYD